MMRHRKLAWRRDTALYAAIAFLMSWQTFKYGFGKEEILTSALAALIAIKAKLSNGNPERGEHEPEK